MKPEIETDSIIGCLNLKSKTPQKSKANIHDRK